MERKFSNKNDLFCTWREFHSTSCVLSTYPKGPARIEKSSIFNFEYVNEVGISGVLGVKAFLFIFQIVAIKLYSMESVTVPCHQMNETSIKINETFYR
jgi:hypothetical protein